LTRSDLTFVYSLGQLSIHFSRASEALRIWGHGEGEDLSVSVPYSGHSFAIVSEAPFQDTLGASTKLLLEFSLSLRKFAAHEQTIREHMKAVRTHEESLDRLRSRRKTVASKADSAERKLNRMDPGHKDAAAQSNLLEQLRDTIRELDSEIMAAEAKLGDLKRTATKAWMVLKFGGLEECCRKGLVRFGSHICRLCLIHIPRLSLNQASASWPNFHRNRQRRASPARSTWVMPALMHMSQMRCVL